MSLIEALYKSATPWLFFKDPEQAHEWGLQKLERFQNSEIQSSVAKRFLTYNNPMLATKLWGLEFPNPFGLAAGFDKDARVLGAIPYFGWGFQTLGAVLRYAQPGNSRPRMWRSRDLQALCNWMGFNSAGVSVVKERLENSPKLSTPVPVFLNIGKNKDTSVEQALDDYAEVFRVLWLFVAAAEANPSSPNTPGLRDYQNAQTLKELLWGLTAINEEMALVHALPKKPIGFKLSPDETDEALQDAVDVAIEVGIDFITLTNTTLSRDNLNGWNIPPDRGGVSGRPLGERSSRVLWEVHNQLKQKGARDNIKLISVGGIYDGHELYKRILFGADLCEAFTAWVFEGPDFVKRSLKIVVERLRLDGFSHLSEAVGTGVH